MISVVQYIVYFVAAAFLYVLIATYFSVAAGFGYFALVLLFAPLFLAFAAGLAFVIPRVSALIALILTVPYFWVGIAAIFYPSPGSDTIFFVLPPTLVLFTSIAVLLRKDRSLWARQEYSAGKTVVGVFAGIPMAIATYCLISIVILLFGL